MEGATGAGVTGASLFALKSAYRVLKSDPIAQYLCASVGNIEEGVGIRLAGRSVLRSVMEEYINHHITCIHVAAELGHHNVIDALVKECNLNVHDTDVNKRNALHYACRRGHLDTVVYLIEKYDIDIDTVDNNKFTAITVAVIGGYVDVTRFLINRAEKGSEKYLARLKQEDGIQKASLLHWSVMSGRLPIVVFLVEELGFSIEQRNSIDKCTPIFWAAFSSSLLVCKYIIDSGANTKRRENASQTIAHYASASGSLLKMRYFVKVLGINSLSDKDDNDHKAYDVAGSVVVAEYIKTAKKNNRWIK